jgi:hypothetical protein
LQTDDRAGRLTASPLRLTSPHLHPLSVQVVIFVILSYTLFFPCGLNAQAKYVRGKETACPLGRLPDYIYCDVPITPVKSPVGSGERRSRGID